MVSIYYSSALFAAFLWAVGSILALISVRYYGVFVFNRWRLSLATLFLASFALITGSYKNFDPSGLLPIILSGIIGIFLGDTALFACMRRLGARRSSILFALNAPLTAILAMIFLNEYLNFMQISGIIITILGVMLAIAFGKRKSQISTWETITPPLWLGVCFGLLAALGQAIGILLLRSVFETHSDPTTIAAIRTGVSALMFWVLLGLGAPMQKLTVPFDKKIFAYLGINALISMAAGMTFVVFALSGADSGIVATLTATTPAIILPLLWISSKEPPAAGAWLGAILAIIGSALIFLG